MVTDRIVFSAIVTVVIILIIPTIGFILDTLYNIINSVLSNSLGSGVAYFIMNRLTFIGVMHHELSHALFAFLLGAKIKSIELFKPKGNRLGQVSYVPRGNKFLQSVQLTMSSIAPTITGAISIYLLISLILSNKLDKIYNVIVVICLVFPILMHMRISKQDVKVAIKGLPLCTILIFISVLLYTLIRGTGVSLTSYISITA